MALRDVLAPVIRLILLIAYTAYIVLGLILMSLGIYYTTSVEGSNDFVTVTAIVGGFFMMVVGGLGVFANLKQLTLFIFICLIIDVLLFVFLLAACIVGIFIANGITDPVSEGVQKAYCDNPAASSHVYCVTSGAYDPNNAGITMRQSNWEPIRQLFESGAPPSCKKYNDDVVALSDAVIREGSACTYTGCDTAECLTAEADDTRCTCVTAIAEVLPQDAVDEGCEVIEAPSPAPGTAAPTPAIPAQACSALVAAGPAGCANPAPQGPLVGTPPAAEWSAVVEGDTPSTPCDFENNTYGGCTATDVTNMRGQCRYIPASDEVVRVFPRAAVERVCPLGCAEVAPIAPVAPVAETCTVLGSTSSSRPGICRACTEAEGTAGFSNDPTPGATTTCAAAGDNTVCGGVAAADLGSATACVALTNCVYMEELMCLVDTDVDTTLAVVTIQNVGVGTYFNQTLVEYAAELGAPRVSTDFQTAATEPSSESHYCTAAGLLSGVGAYDNSNCQYTPAVEEVVEVVGNCSSASAYGAVGSALYPGAKAKAVGDDPTLTACVGTACVTKGLFMGNCTAVAETFSTAAGASPMGASCSTCWDHWQYKVVDDVKGNLWPATITVFALFLFICVLVAVNLYMIDNQVDDDDGFSPDGIFKILGFVFNGIVMLFGLIVIIFGIVVSVDLSDGCPEGSSCTNSAIIGLIIAGVFVFLTAVLSLVSLILGSIIGLMLLRIANIIFCVLALVLLICGIAFAIIAGALDETNKQYEDNFDTVRAQYESQDPGLCHGLDDETCKTKIRNLAASSNTGVVIVLSLICFSFLFVMFLTLEAFYIYKSGGDEDDDDEDDDDE